MSLCSSLHNPILRFLVEFWLQNHDTPNLIDLKYVVGLLVTYVALNLMDGHGQPALLYIVPFTLGNLHSNKQG